MLGGSNVFDPHTEIVHLEPLLGKCLDVFKCADVEGLASIAPVEVSFSNFNAPGRSIVYRADSDCSLLDYNHEIPNLLPSDFAHSVKYAKFRYRLKNRTRTDTVTVHAGKILNYERDGDSAVLEEWLRRRKFIKDTMGIFKNA